MAAARGREGLLFGPGGAEIVHQELGARAGAYACRHCSIIRFIKEDTGRPA